MPSAELERLLARAFEQLPHPRAPRTLLPRVLAAVRAHVERPWYARAWVTWPAGWQTASIAAFVALIAGGTMLMPKALAMVAAAAPAGAATSLAELSVMTRDLVQAAGIAGSATEAVWIVWRVIFAPFVAYAVGVVALMCAACAVMGVTLNHVALGKASLR